MWPIMKWAEDQKIERKFVLVRKESEEKTKIRGHVFLLL